MSAKNFKAGPPTVRPIRRTKVVEYWDCGIPEHRHMTDEVASRCMAREAEKVRKRSEKTKWDEVALAALLARYRAGGVTLASLGREHSLSRERIRQLLSTAERRERRVAVLAALPRDERDLVDLPVRVRNILLAEEINTATDLRKAMAAGRFDDMPGVGRWVRGILKSWLEAHDAGSSPVGPSHRTNAG